MTQQSAGGRGTTSAGERTQATSNPRKGILLASSTTSVSGHPTIPHWRRHERASDRVWLAQGTNITFRSAFTHDILTNANFPIIDDPNPTGPGMPGDILDPNLGDKSEFEAAKNTCAQAWAAL